MFYYDPTYLLILPAVLLAIFAQIRIQKTYSKYSKIKALRGYTGAQLARYILDDRRMTNVKIEPISGRLSDHYNQRTKTLKLSQDIYDGNSVAALGIAAHEAGHAIQDANSYVPLKIRNTIVPVASLGSWMAFPLFFFGFISEIPQLMDLGILFFTLAVTFSLVTLPVEYNASHRAINILQNGRFLSDKEIPMAKKVLSAAALTYLATSAMAILNLLRLVLLRGRRG
jgi:uncharacterized protein